MSAGGVVGEPRREIVQFCKSYVAPRSMVSVSSSTLLSLSFSWVHCLKMADMSLCKSLSTLVLFCSIQWVVDEIPGRGSSGNFYGHVVEGLVELLKPVVKQANVLFVGHKYMQSLGVLRALF